MEQTTTNSQSNERSINESNTNDLPIGTPPSSPKTNSFVRTKSSATIKPRKSIKIGRLKESLRRDSFDKILTSSLENLNATITPPKIEEEEVEEFNDEYYDSVESGVSEKNEEKSQDEQSSTSKSQLSNSSDTIQNNGHSQTSVSVENNVYSPSQPIDQASDNNNAPAVDTTPINATSSIPEVTQESNTQPISPQPSPPAIADPRIKILEELWETESTYVGDLEVIVNMYLIPIRDV